MKHFVLIFASLVVTVVARPQQYGPPRGSYGPPSGSASSGSGPQGPGSSQINSGPKVYKYVTIHVAPTEASAIAPPRVIAPKTPQDTHYQIIFIKAPSPPNQQPTEIELPAEPERKTVVYVLVKKNEPGESQVKIRPSPTKPPSKPEVFFIRYKDSFDGSSSGENNQNGNTGYESSASSQQPSNPQGSYGAPPQPSRPQGSSQQQNQNRPSSSYGGPPPRF